MSEQEESSILDSEEDEESPKPKRENSTIRQMREALEAAKAEAEEAKARASGYEQEFLSTSGLTDKQAAALKAAGYSPTREGVETFRAEVLGVEAASAEESNEGSAEQDETEDEAPDETFVPTRTGGDTPASKREVTSNDLLELMKTDPAKADKLLRGGRVVHKEFNPGGPAF